MKQTVQSYELGLGPIYMHVKKHYCPDCKVQMDIACITETLHGWEAWEKKVGKNLCVNEVDYQKKYFYCPKCYRRIWPKEMKLLELKDKNAVKAEELLEEINKEREAERYTRKRTKEEFRRNAVIQSCCYLLYFFLIAGTNSNLGTCFGIGGVFLHGIIMGNFRKNQEEKKGQFICVGIALLFLIITLLFLYSGF